MWENCIKLLYSWYCIKARLCWYLNVILSYTHYFIASKIFNILFSKSSSSTGTTTNNDFFRLQREKPDGFQLTHSVSSKMSMVFLSIFYEGKLYKKLLYSSYCIKAWLCWYLNVISYTHYFIALKIFNILFSKSSSSTGTTTNNDFFRLQLERFQLTHSISSKMSMVWTQLHSDFLQLIFNSCINYFNVSKDIRVT